MNPGHLTFIALFSLLVLLTGCASTDSTSCSCNPCQCASDSADSGKCSCAAGCQCTNEAASVTEPDEGVDEVEVLVSDADQIRAVMTSQVEAWNGGDIDGFMEGYWKSDDLVFTSGGRIRRGWQATLDGYKASYTKETMGTLAFSDLDIVKTADNEAVVLGRWQLTGLEGNPAGGFTLVFRELAEGWRVVRDHTSSDG